MAWWMLHSMAHGHHILLHGIASSVITADMDGDLQDPGTGGWNTRSIKKWTLACFEWCHQYAEVAIRNYRYEEDDHTLVEREELRSRGQPCG